MNLSNIVGGRRCGNRSKRKQAVARENRHRLTECNVTRGLAAAHRVVVERRKIVMDEAKRVNELDCHCCGHCIRNRSASGTSALEDQNWPQSLSAGEDCMKARRTKVLRKILTCQKVGKRTFDRLQEHRIKRGGSGRSGRGVGCGFGC